MRLYLGTDDRRVNLCIASGIGCAAAFIKGHKEQSIASRLEI